jgi:hypothetical protein
MLKLHFNFGGNKTFKSAVWYKIKNQYPSNKLDYMELLKIFSDQE